MRTKPLSSLAHWLVSLTVFCEKDVGSKFGTVECGECSNNECQMMPLGARETWGTLGTLPLRITLKMACYAPVMEASEVWIRCAATQLSRGCMPYILYIKNNKRPTPICKYYLEIFLLLFERGWREAVHLKRNCIFTVYLFAKWSWLQGEIPKSYFRSTWCNSCYG